MNLGPKMVSLKSDLGNFRIVQKRSFAKDLKSLPKSKLKNVYKLIISIGDDPKELPRNSTSLKGYKNFFRTRMGDYRLIYKVDHHNKQIIIYGIKHRSKIYTKLKGLLN